MPELGGLDPGPSGRTAPGSSIVCAMPGRPRPAAKDACSGSFLVEWIDDTGAGRHLSSIKHIARYFGISPEVVLKWAHAPSEDISFYTGGGSDKKAKLALTIISQMWGRGELRLLDDCPEVRSSGIIVEDLDRPRIHWPGDAPYYVRDKAHCQVICPEWNRIYPVRVEENVPIFADEVVYANPDIVHALPAPPEEEQPPGGPVAPAPPAQGGGEGAGIVVAPPLRRHSHTLTRSSRESERKRPRRSTFEPTSQRTRSVSGASGEG